MECKQFSSIEQFKMILRPVEVHVVKNETFHWLHRIYLTTNCSHMFYLIAN